MVNGYKLVNRWTEHWTVDAPDRALDAPSLNAFKNSLPRIRDNRMVFFMD